MSFNARALSVSNCSWVDYHGKGDPRLGCSPIQSDSRDSVDLLVANIRKIFFATKISSYFFNIFFTSFWESPPAVERMHN